MIRRIVASLVAVALIGVFCASEADAARFRLLSGRGIHRPAVKRSYAPRYRQIDGKSLWDLGKQNGFACSMITPKDNIFKRVIHQILQHIFLCLIDMNVWLSSYFPQIMIHHHSSQRSI